MKLSYEIYEHQFNFLKDPASHRSALGNLYAKDGRMTSANGYVLFDFPESTIDKGEWIEAHSEQHDNHEELVKAYYRFDDYEDDDGELYDSDESPDPSKIGDKYPCVNPLVEGNERSFENVWKAKSELLAHPFDKVAEISAIELWTKCYQQRQLWVNFGKPCIQIPGTDFIMTVENMELALSFPLIIQSKAPIVVYQYKDIINLCANDCQIIIMRYLADTDKPES